MASLVKVSDELMMELDMHGRVPQVQRDFAGNYGHYDRRKFTRLLRRLIRRKNREQAWVRQARALGATQYQTWWWVVVRNACRKYGVRA